MPVKREYSPVPVSVSQSGKYLPDFPAFAIQLSDYTEKTNWERFKGTERKRAGWDYPAPTGTWLADMLGTFDAVVPCEAIRGIRRPNGTYAIVGAGGGLIKAFNYDLNTWVTIGSGYSVDGDAGFLWWQIEDIDGYAVFNNGRDLICSWQVGDASVLPIYEFRESGYASCGHIVEYYGVLICANILEIDPTEMFAIMNGPDPYGTVADDVNHYATHQTVNETTDFAIDAAQDLTLFDVTTGGANPLVSLPSVFDVEVGWYVRIRKADAGIGHVRIPFGGPTYTITDEGGELIVLRVSDDDGYYSIFEPPSFTLLTRIGFERVWSNIGNPRDFAATVTGDIMTGTKNLLLDWPMASFAIGDLIIILGAGAAGGNLTTTITAISGTAITVADNAATTVADAQVSKSTAIDSIVGTDQLEGDGSTIIREMPLKNQLVSYKESGELFQSYYTASVTQPFASQRMAGAAGAKRPIRFPRSLVNILDRYHLFAGAANFYKYELSSQEPVAHEMFYGAEKTAFFDLVTDVTRLKVWAADNQAVGQVYFAFPLGDDSEEAYDEYSARMALSFTYREGDESLDMIDGFHFLCGATCPKPVANDLPDPTEQWFLMGDTDGHVTLYGRSNTTLYTQRRYGELFDSVLAGGLMAFGQLTIDKYIKRLTILMADADASGVMTVELYGARQTNDTPVLLATKDVSDPIFPGVANIHRRRAFFKYRFVCALDTAVRVGGHVWILAGQDIEQISQIAP